MKKSGGCLAWVPSFAAASAGERACFWGRTRYVFLIVFALCLCFHFRLNLRLTVVCLIDLIPVFYQLTMTNARKTTPAVPGIRLVQRRAALLSLRTP